MGSKPKAPAETAAQKAFDIEQRKSLNEETIESNRRRKALTRGQLGAKSLLSGLEETPALQGSAPLDGGTISPGSTTGTSKRVKSASTRSKPPVGSVR